MSKNTVHYQAGAKELLVRLFGRELTDEEIATAAGALDGAMLDVRPKKYQGGMELFVDIQDAQWIEAQQRGFRRDADGRLYIWNHRFKKKKDAAKGLGLKSVVRQIVAARQLGIERIEMFALGDANDPEYNGYYRWAVYGYDAKLTLREQSLLRLDPDLLGAQTVNDVMRRNGKMWWRTQGSARKMIFDLSRESSMMDILRGYLQDKPDLLKELI